MSAVHTHRSIEAPAADVWKILRTFGLPYLKGFSYKLEGTGPGTRRAFDLPGGTMIEQLVAADDDTRTLSYTIIESPWPVKDYRAVIRVSETEAGCLVEWSAEYTPEGADAISAAQIVEGTFKMNLKALDRFLTDG
jgi:hypothetical protein